MHEHPACGFLRPVRVIYLAYVPQALLEDCPFGQKSIHQTLGSKKRLDLTSDKRMGLTIDILGFLVQAR